MKKLMSLGCLLALVFAGASAFAEANGVWFTADLTTVVKGNIWTSVPTSWNATSKSFNDWTTPLTYKATEAAALTDYDSTIVTSVKFTPIDGTDTPAGEIPEDLLSVDIKGAKAGLTVVQTGTDSYSYYGIASGNGTDDAAWVKLTGASPDLTKAVEVKVAVFSADTGAIIKYSVDNNILYPSNGEFISAASVTSFESVSYLGNCPEIASLSGNKFSNEPEAKETIHPTKTGVPATISYNRQDLLDRNVDPDNADAVMTYLTTARANGLCGWVNTALGIADTQTVAVASSQCQESGSITLDYGFLTNGTGAVTYKVDTAAEGTSATISTTSSGIHTVKVYVTGEDGTTKVEVGSEQVGVMNTGKDTKNVPSGEKTFDIVAVPFESFKGQVTVANVLNTAELTLGDMLYILNEGKYDTFELKEGKVWEEVGETSYSRKTTAKASKTDPSEYFLYPGEAIWIERDANSKIVFAGKGETTQSHSKVAASGYTLVANPTVNGFDIAGIAGNVGDMIIVEDVAAPAQYEKRTEGWGRWTSEVVGTVRDHPVTENRFTLGGTIPAGIGFWYYNTGNASVTINFGTNAAK